MKDLRVAAEIERTDGKRLKFTRRKGNRDTILDPDDRPIPEGIALELEMGRYWLPMDMQTLVEEQPPGEFGHLF
jgi:hypothetical protein